ncbi:MAG: aldo/keto reductase [Cyanobacteria bacterium J06635_13]
MISREFGRSGIRLSPITFGSMRLNAQIGLDRAVELISYLYDHGVNTFHSSHEYDTDAFFCQVLKRFRAQNPSAEVKHIAKIGVPHFGEGEFSGDRLITLIENRLRDLGTERIDVVQWLVRHQPNEDRYRLPILDACQAELEIIWSQLQQAGKVGALASFPYSLPFAAAVLKLPTCQGLVTYLNLLELEMTPLLEQMANRGQGYIAIRPLYGGLITSSSAMVKSAAGNQAQNQKLRAIASSLNISPANMTKFAIQFPLIHPVVTSVMVSVSSIEHASEIIAAVEDLKSDRQAFNKILLNSLE